MQRNISEVEFEAYKELADVHIHIFRDKRTIKGRYGFGYGKVGVITDWHAIIFNNDRGIRISNVGMPNDIESIELLVMHSNRRLLIKIECTDGQCTYLTDLDGYLLQRPFLLGWFYCKEIDKLFIEILVSEHQKTGEARLYHCYDFLNHGTVDLLEGVMSTMYIGEDD